jgi:hypothetical protein
LPSCAWPNSYKRLPPLSTPQAEAAMAAQCAGAAIYQHSPDIRGFAASVALLTGFGNSQLPSFTGVGAWICRKSSNFSDLRETSIFEFDVFQGFNVPMHQRCPSHLSWCFTHCTTPW